MSKYFVTSDPVAVYEFDPATTESDQPPNVIWIRPRMSVEVKGRVTSDLVALGADQKTLEFRAGANELALLVHNIVRWSGPDLDGVPCDADHIRQLDPTEPHIARVLEEIARRNTTQASGNPKSVGANGLPSVGAPGSNTLRESIAHRLATTTSK